MVKKRIMGVVIVRNGIAVQSIGFARNGRRQSTGGLGNLGLAEVRARLRAARAWNAREQRRFDGAMDRLAGR